MTFKTKQSIQVVLLIVLTLASLELLLAALALGFTRVDRLLSPDGAMSPIVSDARLGHRPSPDYHGHDRKGFRNREVPASAHIVALGDSQTYGTGVEAEQAWPRQLEALTGKTVYGMASGGYGPAHSLMLWDEATSLSPAIVIEAFYVGNDLFDSFDFVYNQGRFPELKTPDAEVQGAVRAAERSDPISSKVSLMFQSGMTPVAREGFRHLLAQHSNLYGLTRSAWREFGRLFDEPDDTPQAQWEKAKAFAMAHPAYSQVFTDGRFNTIFTSEYRLAAIDQRDPRIAEGLRISLRAIETMNARAGAGHVRFVVLLIPTKEAVFRRRWQNPSASFLTLAENEALVWTNTKAFLERKGIAYIDALPELESLLAKGIQPYHASRDGHPNRRGHQAIAKLVAEHLGAPGRPRAHVQPSTTTVAPELPRPSQPASSGPTVLNLRASSRYRHCRSRRG